MEMDGFNGLNGMDLAKKTQRINQWKMESLVKMKIDEFGVAGYEHGVPKGKPNPKANGH